MRRHKALCCRRPKTNTVLEVEQQRCACPCNPAAPPLHVTDRSRRPNRQAVPCLGSPSCAASRAPHARPLPHRRNGDWARTGAAGITVPSPESRAKNSEARSAAHVGQGRAAVCAPEPGRAGQGSQRDRESVVRQHVRYLLRRHMLGWRGNNSFLFWRGSLPCCWAWLLQSRRGQRVRIGHRLYARSPSPLRGNPPFAPH